MTTQTHDPEVHALRSETREGLAETNRRIDSLQRSVDTLRRLRSDGSWDTDNVLHMALAYLPPAGLFTFIMGFAIGSA